MLGSLLKDEHGDIDFQFSILFFFMAKHLHIVMGKCQTLCLEARFHSLPLLYALSGHSHAGFLLCLFSV